MLLVVSRELPTLVHNGRAGAFRSWLKVILTNRVRHFLRSRRNREGAVEPRPLDDWLEQLTDPASALSQQWGRGHDPHLVRQTPASIRAEFNETTWRTFHLLVLEDRPVAEVAATLGITANAVYVARARVLARLREELRGLMDG